MQKKLKYKELKTAKSRTTTYSFIAFIIFITLLIYIHDTIPQGMARIGKSSLRVYLYTVFAELRFLLVWFIVRHLAKGKSWRFVIWLPIIVTTYQLFIRVLVLQKTEFNDFNIKFVLTIVSFVGLIMFFFYKKALNTKQ